MQFKDCETIIWFVLQDNVALIAVLEALEPPQPEGANRRQLICIANTHIHANPELNDVKLWQVHMLLAFPPTCMYNFAPYVDRVQLQMCFSCGFSDSSRTSSVYLNIATYSQC